MKLVGQGRLATLKLASDVAKRLRKRFQLGPVENPAVEARVLQRFLKLARKRKLSAKAAAAAAAMSSMDNLDTLVMEETPFEHDEDRPVCYQSLGMLVMFPRYALNKLESELLQTWDPVNSIAAWAHLIWAPGFPKQ